MEKTERPPLKLLFLVLPAAVCSAFTGNTYITAIPSLILIILSYFISFSFKKNSFYSTLACLGIFGISLLFHVIMVTDLPTGNGPHVMAASMIVLMVYLWYYQNPKLAGDIIILLSLLVFIFTGNNLDDGKSTYYIFIMILIPFITLLMLSGEKKFFSGVKTVIFLSFITLVFVFSFSLNKALFFTSEQLNALLQETTIFKDYLNKVGLSNKFDIESHVKLKTSIKPVIFLETDQNVEYLRADVLTNYSKKSWNPPPKLLKPPLKVKYNGTELNTYDEITAKEFSKSNKISSGKIEFIENSRFLPLPVSTRAVTGSKLNVKPYYVFENSESENKLIFYTSENNYIPVLDVNNSDTDISDEIKNKLQIFTLKMVSGAKTNIKKAELIQNYFHNNFEYSLNVDFDPQKDPIIDFIFNKKKGFCVHFASGMVFMLRSIGIPSHLVSGYIVSEYSKTYNSYIIRERDAHAWVEVYDEKGQKWITFDPTPVKLMFEYVKQEPQLSDRFNIFFRMMFIKVKDLFTGFSLESVTKIGTSPFTYILIILFIIYFGFKSFSGKKSIEKKEFIIDKNTEKLRQKLLKLLNENNIKFPENMTFGELLNEINNSEIEQNSKDNLKGLIMLYQKYRYTSSRLENDRTVIEKMLEKLMK